MGIEAILIAAAPSIAAIAGCITAYFKMKSNNKESNNEMKAEYQRVREKNEEVIKQAEETKIQYEALLKAFNESVKLNKELLTKIDGIARKEE